MGSGKIVLHFTNSSLPVSSDLVIFQILVWFTKSWKKISPFPKSNSN